MSYKLKHTAEEIDYKLDLVDKNKNLLPYPYDVLFSAGLEDVGDGSVLTTGIRCEESGSSVLLATRSLPVGKKYIVSLTATDLIDTTVIEQHGFELKVNFGDTSVIAKKDTEFMADLDLTAITGDEKGEIVITVYLTIPTVFTNNVLIKPQIEESRVLADGQLQTTPTAWVPYMKSIGSYVDERFNSTNAKLRILSNAAGLPSVTTSDNGKILCVVNGAWAATSIVNAEDVTF